MSEVSWQRTIERRTAQLFISMQKLRRFGCCEMRSLSRQRMDLAVHARFWNAGIQLRLVWISPLSIALAAMTSCDRGCPNWEDA